METDARANAKIKSLPRAVRDELWLMRNPMEEGDKKLTFVEILAWLQKEHGVASSLGALSAYYAWEKINRDIEDGVAAAEQAKLEFAMKYPDASPEKLHELGQLIFTAKTMQADNLEGWLKVMELWERKQDRLMRKEQWEEKLADKRKKEDAENAIKRVQSDKTLSPDEKRSAIVQTMDEFFGLKKDK